MRKIFFVKFDESVFEKNYIIFFTNCTNPLLIKDFYAIYEEKNKEAVFDVLRHFDTNVIDYTRFEEKLLYGLKTHVKTNVDNFPSVHVTNHKSKKFSFKKDGTYFAKDFNNTFGGSFQVVRWSEFKSKQKKNSY
ncbi:MAG: hypothetical protein EOM19_07035 [Candidatus Moranbacteria bacterium]|nr:hypothetical protein [Candidatus Moranbacteria bacterium]